MVTDAAAHEKGVMGLLVRTIGIARAGVKIGLASLAYNMHRFVRLEGRSTFIIAT
jgi:IS5 family transposase